jgi:hypothetical protein
MPCIVSLWVSFCYAPLQQSWLSASIWYLCRPWLVISSGVNSWRVAMHAIARVIIYSGSCSLTTQTSTRNVLVTTYPGHSRFSWNFSRLLQINPASQNMHISIDLAIIWFWLSLFLFFIFWPLENCHWNMPLLIDACLERLQRAIISNISCMGKWMCGTRYDSQK